MDVHRDMCGRTGSFPLLALLTSLVLLPTPAGAAPPAFADVLSSSDPDLLVNWGKRYQYGAGAPQSIDRAIELYCAAARLGHADAQLRLGEIYSRKLAGKQDELLAAAWLLKAASKSRSAKRMLTRWDLSGAAFPAEPECVLSDRMVARTLPRPLPVTAAPAKPAEAKPVGPAKPRFAGPNPRREEIAALVQQLAPSYRLNPDLVLAVIEVESNFNPRAVSPKRAQGLMQLIPATAKRFGVADPYDPHENVRGGMAYLRWLLDHFDGDLKLALAGYNAGEKAVERHGGVPPYAETQAYVRRVANVLGVTEDRLDTHAAPPPPPAGIWTSGQMPRGRVPEGDWESRFFETGVSG